MADTERTRTASMERVENFRFQIDFGAGMPQMIADEPQPLGGNTGPNAGQLLAAAIGNCLGASLTLCLQKSRTDIRSMSAFVTLRLERNEAGRLRVHDGDATLHLDAAGDGARIERCLGMFEDYCIVTATLRQAFPIEVRVVDGEGNELHHSGRETAVAT